MNIEDYDLKKYQEVEIDKFFQEFESLLNELNIVNPLDGSYINSDNEVVTNPNWTDEDKQKFFKTVHDRWMSKLDMEQYKK